MTARELIARVYDHLDGGRVDLAVFSCLRLSRNLGDTASAIIFLRELCPDKDQLSRAFLHETERLRDEARKYLWEKSLNQWIESRTLGFSLDVDDPEKTVLSGGVVSLLRDLEQFERAADDLRVPSGMGEYDTAYFADKWKAERTIYRLRVRATHTVLERIQTRCLEYASRVERQLDAQEESSNAVGQIQNVVDNYFAAHAPDVSDRLHKAGQLARSQDPEDHSLLLTSIRRAMKAAADHFYPPVGRVECADGVTRDLGESQYLNRLHEFVIGRLPRTATNELFLAELEYLCVFLRKLNDLASKGVHAEVSVSEARQGLFGIYMFLSNVISRLQVKEER